MNPTLHAPAETAADLEGLQGAWVSVAGRRPAQLLVAGNHYAFRFLDGEIYIGTFDVDADGRPKSMRMTIDEGPARYRGKAALCIYELGDDSLRWCPTEPGSDRRLTAFPPPEDCKHLCLIFRRDRPRK